MQNPISETTSGYLSTLRNEKYASLLPSLLYTILKIDFSGDVYLSASNVSLSINFHYMPLSAKKKERGDL